MRWMLASLSLVTGLITHPVAADTREVEATSLLGQPLSPPHLPDGVHAERLERLEQAQADLFEQPGNIDALIWVGRRLAYLGRYQESVEVYTAGIAKSPEDARLYRHRGHRYITLRQFDRAIADLERAAALVEGQPDQIEPDGLPNARGIPTSTLQGNVHYHLGLAYYLQGRFNDAVATYRDCLATATNPDMESAARYWLYLASARAELPSQVLAGVLEPVAKEWDIIENHAYHRLLLAYRGEPLPEASGDDAITGATLAYGLAMADYLAGRLEDFRRQLREIVASPQWAAFGAIAAEADLARMGS